MKHSITSFTKSNKNRKQVILWVIVLITLFVLSLFIGKYHFSIKELLSGDQFQLKVFVQLRLSRTLVGCIGGFSLATAGYIYQNVFKNQLAAPDIIGVSSGASVGAAVGILFLSSAYAVTASAFIGALLAVVLSLALASIDRNGGKSSVVLAGIAVHSFAQMILMFLKITSDPQKELAAIEFWIMGGLSGITMNKALLNCIIAVVGIFVMFVLHRQSILLSTEETEAKMLGVNVGLTRLIVLISATLAVSCIVSITGLISFVGLIAPHCGKKLVGNNSVETMLVSGLFGSCLLLVADILARSITTSELPISIFTSLIGAPFLVYLIFARRMK